MNTNKRVVAGCAVVALFFSTSPVQARLLQVDPIGTKDDLNLYAYVYNDPLNKTDPTGTEGACSVLGTCAQHINHTAEDRAASASIVADFAPGINDIKGIAEAIADPTAINISAAAIGLVPGIGDAIGKGLKAGANMLENAAKGAKAEAAVVSKLGDQVAGQRVTLESTTGQRSVADIVTTDKGVVEVKSGGARLSPGQKAVQADVEAGRDVIPRGQNAENAGLTPGQPTKMTCYKVERC